MVAQVVCTAPHAALAHSLCRCRACGVFRFDPELIGMTATRSLVSLLLEVGCISALFYLSDAPQSPALLDLLSLCSYKYVALNIDILVGIILGPTPFWIVFLALAVSTAVFMVSAVHTPAGLDALCGSGMRWDAMRLWLDAPRQLT